MPRLYCVCAAAAPQVCHGCVAGANRLYGGCAAGAPGDLYVCPTCVLRVCRGCAAGVPRVWHRYDRSVLRLAYVRAANVRSRYVGHEGVSCTRLHYRELVGFQFVEQFLALIDILDFIPHPCCSLDVTNLR